MKNIRVTITRRVKTTFWASIVMILMGLSLASSTLLMLGVGFLFFILADFAADNLPLKSK